MENKKKWILNCILLLVITAFTLVVVLWEENPKQFLVLLDMANGWYWIGAAILIFPFVACESLILYLLLKNVNEKPKMGHCLIYSFIGFFFSSITPAAGGGQPAQVYYMHKDGLNPGVTTPILIVVTMGYKLVLVIAGIVLFVLRPASLVKMEPAGILWASAGWVANVVIVSFFAILILFPAFVEKLCRKLLQIFGKYLKKERTNRLQGKLDQAIEKYQTVSQCVKNNGFLMGIVIIISIVQRSILFSITWIVLQSFHIVRIPSLFEVILLQAMVSLGTDLIPLPGGSGANEALFLLLFADICGEALDAPVLLASRGISYYGQLVLCGLMVAIFARKLGRNFRKKEVDIK